MELFLITSVVFGLAFVLSVLSYGKLVTKYNSLKNKEEGMEELAHARRRARKIVEEAGERAQKIIEEAQLVGKDAQGAMHRALESAVDEVSSELKKRAAQELGEFRSALAEQTSIAKEALEKVTSEENDRVKQEVEAYKKQKLEEVDRAIYEIVREVTRKVLGEAITQQQHEKLVIAALDDAKQHHIL